MLLEHWFLRWLLFNVAIAVVPILLNALYLFTFSSFSWDALLGRGELLLITVGLCATALADAYSVMERSRGRLLVIFGCIVDTIVASFYFALVSGKYNSLEPQSTTPVVVTSLVCYGSAVCCSFFARRFARGQL